MPTSNSKRSFYNATLLSSGALLLFLAVYKLSVAFSFTGRATQADAEPAGKTNEPAHYTETIPGSRVRFDMVAIPGGEFWMGSPGGEARREKDEGPRHPVTLRPFWMGKTEVTWDEYDLYRKGGPNSEMDNETTRLKDVDAITRPTLPYPDETRGFGRERYPVVGITHHAAMEYCRWLSRQTGKVYRLPTEAEWEYACRARTRTAYFFGNDPAQLGEYAWHDKNSDESTAPVGLTKPNPWGLHDMYGNVAEWCLDHYQPDYYRAFPLDELTLNPIKLPTANRFPHVVRGGSWADAPDRCRSAVRRGSDKSWNRIDPAKPQNIWWLWNADFVGFRVVRAVDERDNRMDLKSRVTKKSP